MLIKLIEHPMIPMLFFGVFCFVFTLASTYRTRLYEKGYTIDSFIKKGGLNIREESDFKAVKTFSIVVLGLAAIAMFLMMLTSANAVLLSKSEATNVLGVLTSGQFIVMACVSIIAGIVFEKLFNHEVSKVSANTSHGDATENNDQDDNEYNARKDALIARERSLRAQFVKDIENRDFRNEYSRLVDIADDDAHQINAVLAATHYHPGIDLDYYEEMLDELADVLDSLENRIFNK